MLDSAKVQYPPLPLIQTWVWMMIESGNPEIQDKGRDNLIAAVGSLAKANECIVERSNKEIKQRRRDSAFVFTLAAIVND